MSKRSVFKMIGLILVDFLILVAIYGLSIYLLSDITKLDQAIYLILGLIILKIVIFMLLSLYNILFSYVGILETIKVSIGIIVSNIIAYIIILIISFNEVSWVLFLYTTPVEILLLGGVRFSKRLYNRIFVSKILKNNNKHLNTLVVGAGSAAKIAFDEMNSNSKLFNKVIAFIDDDERKINQKLNGLPVHGPIANIDEYIDKYEISEVVIAIANISRQRLSEIVEIISKSSVKIKRLPLLLEDKDYEQRKLVDVKIEDLLNRGVIELENKEITEFINNKVVLVTGGGGSIGSELCKQIIIQNPKQLILFDIYENTTYEVQLDLHDLIKKQSLKTELIVLIGSVYNKLRVENVFKEYKPNLIFHAAAYKHVPLMEDSAHEAVRTNVIGTYNVASLANQYDVEKMILVSSDKAVRPTNIMGATKAVCENIIQYFDLNSKTSYSAVRFGNVLGSHGSVVPVFKKQIEVGGPVTITHPEITRFFMTIPEAVSLILQSAVYASGGELFILDMGEPVKIVNLAEKMIRLSGYVPNTDIKIEYIGLRPGEKLYEELLLDVSKHKKTNNNKIFVEEKREIKDVESFIQLIRNNLDKSNNLQMKELVKQLITTYKIDMKSEKGE